MPKKIRLSFKNPVNEVGIDHLEVWWRLGPVGPYAQLGSDIPFVGGVTPYLVDDLSSNVSREAMLHYEVRAYNTAGASTVVAALIQVSNTVVEVYTETEIFTSTEVFK